MRLTGLAAIATLAALAVTQSALGAAGSWHRLPDMPVGEQNAAVAADGGKLYVIGGYENEKIVRIYDPAAKTWTTAPYALPQGRWGAAATTVAGRVLLFGGGHGDFDFYGTRTTYIVDPAAGTVSRGARAPTPLELAASLRMPGTHSVLVVGGHEQQEVGPQLRHTPVFLYNSDAGSWRRLHPLPVHRSLIGGTLVRSGRHIYYYGGLVDIVFGPVSRAVFLYHAHSDTWTKVARLPGGVWATEQGATGADGRIYMVGSGTGDRLTTVFDPETDTFSKGPAIPGTDGPRSVVALDGTIYALGGSYESQGESFVAGYAWALPTTP
jgi:N-acetylneuraminic acid mutarotase